MIELKQKYDSLKTREEKRQYALDIIKDDHYAIDIISFDKIAETTIDILFYKYIGYKYTVKRTYKAKHKDDKNL